MSVLITKATPAPGLAHRRATDAEVASWTPEQLAVYSCRHCHTAYRPGSGANWVCEHWHERHSAAFGP